MHFALNSVAVLCCWVTAHLHDERIHIGVLAMAGLMSACYAEKQWELHFALNNAAVHWCWVTAHLYEERISIGVTAVTHCRL